jgi:hypothetical protein
MMTKRWHAIRLGSSGLLTPAFRRLESNVMVSSCDGSMSE